MIQTRQVVGCLGQSVLSEIAANSRNPTGNTALTTSQRDVIVA